MDKKKLKEKILFPVFDIFLNAFNYGFHIYSSWYLIKERYAALNAHLALISIAMVVGIALQYNSAKISAGIDLSIEQLKLPNPALFSTPLIILLIISGKWLAPFLKGNYLNILLISVIFFSHSVLSSFRGIMQGQGSFYKLNISFYIEVGVKVIVLFLLLPRIQSIFIPILSILLAYLISLIHIYISYIKGIKGSLVFHGVKGLLDENYVAIFILSQFFIYCFFSVDMILINGLHSSFAPDYAVIQKVGMIQFFVGSSLMSVFLPELSGRNTNKDFIKRWKLFFIILIGILVIAQVFYNTIMPILIPYLFGQQYSTTVEYIPLGGLLFAIIVIMNYFITTLLAKGNRSFLFVLLVGLIIISCLIIVLSNLKAIIISEILIYLLVSLALYIIIKKEFKSE